jgi:4-hydroxy-tetrahydrodipicolinate synthase
MEPLPFRRAGFSWLNIGSEARVMTRRRIDDEAELRQRLKAVHCYVATPFRDDDLLAVDHAAMAANIDAIVERGVRVVAVGGGTGECEQLSAAELAAVARTAVGAVGDRAVVIAGLPPDLTEAIELTGTYEDVGVDALLVIPPQVRWRVPPDLEGVARWIEALAARTDLPLMPYNVQGWPAEFFERLATIKTVIGVKDPCADPHPFFRAIQRLGDRFAWIGNKRHDPGVAHLRYQMGMEGFTSGMCNFMPEPELALHEACVRGKWDRAVAIQALCAPLERSRRAADDASVVKVSMDAVGLRGGRVRPPRLDLSSEAAQAVRAEVSKVEKEWRAAGLGSAA